MKDQPTMKVMPKVSLVPPELSMAEPLYSTIKNNFTHVAPFLDFITDDVTVEDERAYLKMMIQQ
ncbi:N-acetyltransferase, partial [Mammaliicoccus sciuri]